MAGLNSFEDFTKARAQRLAEEEAQKQTEVREETVRSFRELLSEYGVTKVSELDEEKRGEFFSRLEGTDLNESISLVEEGTRSFFGKINKKGDIEAVYMHYDGYPENMLPLIQKGYSGSKRKNIDTVIQNGAGSGLEADPKKINYYNDGDGPLTGNVGYIRDFIGDAKQSWAEFIYLYDERDAKWYMADTYEDSDLKPAFEMVETTRFEKFVFEATGSFPIEYKRDAKKVVTQYSRIFGKEYTSLVDGGKQQLGAIKLLFQSAMEDANFSREGNAIAKHIKGSLGPVMISTSGLGKVQAKVSARAIADALYNEASRLSNAAGYGGQGIVEGTAMYLDQIGQGTMAAKLIADFHAQFESKEVLEARIVEGNEFGAARAKAIADGEDEFEVDGEKYPVTKVDKEDKENAEEFAVESTVNEWGGSDQYAMNQSIHREMGKPKKMPSPFDKKLRSIAADNVDFYWDEWPEYRTNYDGLVDDAIRSYLRAFFKNEFNMMVRMFEPMESATNDAKFDKKKLLKLIKNHDDAEILVNGNWYIIYNPDNGNDENTEMWAEDDVIFALDTDGGEHEISYKDIEQFKESVEVSEGLNKSDIQYQLAIAYSGNTPPKVTKLNKKKLEVRYGYKVNPEHVIDQVKMLYPEVELKHTGWGNIPSGGGIHSFDIKESVKEAIKSQGKAIKKGDKFTDEDGDLFTVTKVASNKIELKDEENGYNTTFPDDFDDDDFDSWFVKESVVTEAEVKSDEEFKEYTFAVLQKVFGDKFDKEKAQEIVDGLISKHSGDYGAMVGALQTSLG